MIHLHQDQVIEAAEALNMPSRPTMNQLQKLAEKLGTTYGWTAAIWDGCGIGKKIMSPRAVAEREKERRKKEKAADKKVHRCKICGTTDLGKKATVCSLCAAQKRREWIEDELWAEAQKKGAAR